MPKRDRGFASKWRDDAAAMMKGATAIRKLYIKIRIRRWIGSDWIGWRRRRVCIWQFDRFALDSSAMKTLLTGLALAFGLINSSLLAQESGRGVPLNDPLLDKLTGDWNVERKMANGRMEKNAVHGEWVLQHKFIELHYRDVASPPKYEAIVLIGYDGIAKHYICHWMDNFGADYSAMGYAPREEGSNAAEFKFTFHDGELTNRFAFDPKRNGWTSTIRQTNDKGEWKLFCEDSFTKEKH